MALARSSSQTVTALLNSNNSLDGVSLTVGMRIILVSVGGLPLNVNIVSGSAGSWVLTEDLNILSKGDTVYVKEGSHGGERWVYNGTTWVLILASDTTTSIKTAENITTEVVLDELDSGESQTAKWIIQAVESSVPANTFSAELLATHDFTNISHSIYGVQTFGANIDGMAFTTALEVVGSEQKLQLLVSSIAPANFKSIRIST